MSDADGLGTNAAESHRFGGLRMETARTDGFAFGVEKAFDEQRTRLTISGEISSTCEEVVESCSTRRSGMAKP